ncbi:hypothetical protein O1L55_19100 [Streptomyces albulus]|nr:hypothetical protein [Streptomyces noursei]
MAAIAVAGRTGTHVRECTRTRRRTGDGGALPSRPPQRARSLVGAALLLVGTLLLPLSLAALWARAELTDTERYVAAVAPLAGNPAVQDAIVRDVTDGVMPHVRLDGLLKVVPRTERPALRRKFTRGIREFVDKQVRQVVTGRTFPAMWTGVHRTAHRTLDGTLTASGDAPSPSTSRRSSSASGTSCPATGWASTSSAGCRPPAPRSCC